MTYLYTRYRLKQITFIRIFKSNVWSVLLKLNTNISCFLKFSEGGSPHGTRASFQLLQEIFLRKLSFFFFKQTHLHLPVRLLISRWWERMRITNVCLHQRNPFGKLCSPLCALLLSLGWLLLRGAALCSSFTNGPNARHRLRPLECARALTCVFFLNEWLSIGVVYCARAPMWVCWEGCWWWGAFFVCFR